MGLYVFFGVVLNHQDFVGRFETLLELCNKHGWTVLQTKDRYIVAVTSTLAKTGGVFYTDANDHANDHLCCHYSSRGSQNAKNNIAVTKVEVQTLQDALMVLYREPIEPKWMDIDI